MIVHECAVLNIPAVLHGTNKCIQEVALKMICKAKLQFFFLPICFVYQCIKEAFLTYLEKLWVTVEKVFCMQNSVFVFSKCFCRTGANISENGDQTLRLERAYWAASLNDSLKSLGVAGGVNK